MVSRFVLFIACLLLGVWAHAGIVIHNGLTHIFKVKSGEVYKGVISLENTAKAPQNVKVYMQDVRYKWSGEIYYTNPQSHDHSNAAWIRLGGTQLTLQAGEKADLPYEIWVPQNLREASSYWSVIIIEPENPIEPDKIGKGITIHSVVRYAIQIITNYNTDELKPNLKFEHIKVEKEQNNRILKVAVSNLGSVFCKSIVSADLYDRRNGQKIGTYQSVPMSLLPGNSKSFFIDISSVPRGQYTSVIMAVDEDENAFALNAELDIKDD